MPICFFQGSAVWSWAGSQGGDCRALGKEKLSEETTSKGQPGREGCTDGKQLTHPGQHLTADMNSSQQGACS